LELDPSAAKSSPCGTFSSSTMMVMMMAITPSVKASSRPLVMSLSVVTRQHTLSAAVSTPD